MPARGLIATVLLATGMVVVAPPASAAGPTVVYEFGASDFDSERWKSVRVPCPPDTKIFGGSFVLQDADGAVVLDDFTPYERTDVGESGLIVSAGEITGDGEPSDGATQRWKITVKAACGTPPPGYSIINRVSDFKHAGSQEEVAPCPPERRVLGGGASLSNGWGQVSITGLNIGHTTTRATAEVDKDGYSGAWSIRTFAICADPVPGWNVVTRQSVSAAELSKTEAAYCPRPQRVIGGAWEIHYLSDFVDKADRYVTRTVLDESPDPGITVTALAIPNVVQLQRWTIEANAVCID